MIRSELVVCNQRVPVGMRGMRHRHGTDAGDRGEGRGRRRRPGRAGHPPWRSCASGVDSFGVPLDVTDDASVAAAGLVGERASRLDVLVNNAGVTGGIPQEPTRVDLAAVRTAVETNVIGVIRVTNAMVPLLRRSASPRIVNMSSSVGSLTRQAAATGETGPISAAYAPSKTFLNAVTVQHAKELQDTSILINAACPGYCATDLNGFRGVRTPAQARRSPVPPGWDWLPLPASPPAPAPAAAARH